jgi:nitroreductase
MSVRAFKPDPVPGAVVRELLEAAARAPSGGNLQPWVVHALAGEPLKDFKALVASRLMDRDEPEYHVYPPNLWEGKGAKRPGLARMICSYEYRFDEVRRFARPLSGSLRIADF